MKNQYSVENWKMPPSTTGGRVRTRHRDRKSAAKSTPVHAARLQADDIWMGSPVLLKTFA